MSLSSVSVQQLQSFLDSATDLLVLLSRNYTVLAMNVRAKEGLYALTGRELRLKDDIREFLPEPYKERFFASFAQALKGQVVRSETEILFPDGTSAWYAFRYSPALDKHGVIEGISVGAHNIQEQKEKEEAIRQSERRFRDLIEGSIQGIVIHREFHPLFVNETFANIYGFSSVQEVLQLPDLLSIMPPRMLYDTHDLWKTLLSSNMDGVVSRVENVRKDGTTIWVDVIQRKIMWEGEVAIQMTVVDATQRHEAEQLLIKTQSDLFEAQRIAGIGSFEILLQSLRVRVSPMLYEILGIDDIAELTATRLSEIVHPNDLDSLVQAFESAIANGKALKMDFRIIRRDVRRDLRAVWLSLSGRLLRDIKGKPVKIIGTLQDISQRKRDEEELRRTRDIADRASRAKSEFIANVSHEIRTPMNAILGYIELLRDSGLQEHQRGYVDSIERSGRMLMNLINDVLDFSKIEAGRMTIQRRPTSLRRLVDDLYQIFTGVAREKELSLVVDIADDVPLVVFVDEIRLQQVLLNLVGNALKFTEFGHVAIRLRAAFPSGADVILQQELLEYLAERSKGSHRLRACSLTVDVEDTGIGIPPDQLEAIFEAFRQQDGQSTRRYGGTGLGLTISRRLAEMMNGDITVRSEPGYGSTFSVLLDEVPYTNSPDELAVPLFEGADQFLSTDVPVESAHPAMHGQAAASRLSSLRSTPTVSVAAKLIGVSDHFHEGKLLERTKQLREEISRLTKAECDNLATMLLGDVSALWNTLSESGAMQTKEAIRFGELIRTIGSMFRLAVLEQYGSAVIEYAQSFDIRNVGKTVKQFPVLLDIVIASTPTQSSSAAL
jgi:PAS domain S-box-containing protein